ncbi:MAG: porphobilinogen synthase [Hyphomicrobiales bacterium]|nr:porphobilinogen synthase [Hyphomicrobiales bacterium]
MIESRRIFPGTYPATRLRRNRKAAWSREMTAECHLHPSNLIWPVFVLEGQNIRQEVTKMPGVYRYSPDVLAEEVKKARDLGIPAVAIFPVVEDSKKTADGGEALKVDNLAGRTVALLKQQVPEIGVICDVALDPYTSHGQDGIVENGVVVNDRTVEMLCRQAGVLAEAGCDIVAPSDMMDGRVGEIRLALDDKGYQNVQIMSYAAKYASHFYGPFRDAVGSAGRLGRADKKTYQMDPANRREALREVALDIEEGADSIIIKPGMAYLDIIRDVSVTFPVPVFAYQVSGEYAMIKAAATNGWIDEMPVMLETLLAFRRAGAVGVLTYAACEVAKVLRT